MYVPASSIPTVEAALAERRAHGLDPIAIELVESPDTFIAGQESAVVNALGRRRDAVPSFVGLASIRERGVGGRPTLVQNVETLAQVALVARFGADWFRRVGTHENPGTMLLTVNAPGRPLVVEAALGSSLRAATGLGEDVSPVPAAPPRRLRGRLGLAGGLRASSPCRREPPAGPARRSAPA